MRILHESRYVSLPLHKHYHYLFHFLKKKKKKYGKQF